MPAPTQNNPFVIFIKFWLPVLICMGFIFYASSIPASDIPSLFPSQDIAYHFGAYLILALFCVRALRHTYLGISGRNLILFVLAFGIFYGLTDEWHQFFIAGRTASGFDVFIDTIGTFIGSTYPWLR